MYTNLCTKQQVVYIATHRFVDISLIATVRWNSTFSDKFKGVFRGFTKGE